MAQIESMIALGVKPVEVEDPLTIQQRRLTIGHLAQQNQMGQLALEDHQRETEDQRKLQQFYAQSGGDITKLRELAAGQVSTKAMMALDKALLDHRKTLAELGEKELANQKIHAERIAAGAQSILSAAPEARPELYAQARQQFIQEGHAKPTDLPEQYPGGEWLTLHANAGRTAQQIIEGIYKEREDKRAAEDANRKQGEYDATLPGKQAKSVQEQWQAWAPLAASINDDATWQRFLNNPRVPAEIRKELPAMWSPNVKAEMQAKGMTSDQQVTTAATAARDAATATHYKNEDANAASRLNLERAKFNAEKGNTGDLVKAVMDNPAVFDGLTPTAKTAIAPELARQGFAGFGKPLSESAITKMSDSRSAISSLRDLRTTLQENEKYLGPVSGLSALNPYSEARQAQAKIDLVKQRVGKALEGGVLRKEDEEKYKKILATLQDTPANAIAKVDNVIQSLERDLDTFVEEQRRAGRKVNTTGSGQATSGTNTQPTTGGYKFSATGQDGHKIGSNDGQTWYDLTTGKKL